MRLGPGQRFTLGIERQVGLGPSGTKGVVRRAGCPAIQRHESLGVGDVLQHLLQEGGVA